MPNLELEKWQFNIKKFCPKFDINQTKFLFSVQTTGYNFI